MSNLEFVVLMSTNPKEEEVYLYYLQWTGNEERLTYLDSLLKACDFEVVYDRRSTMMVPMHLDIKNRLPEAAVDAHVKVSDINSYSKMFTKCTGEFNFNPDEEEKEELLKMDPYELGEYLCGMFVPYRIDGWFKPSFERSYAMGGSYLPPPAAAAATAKLEHLMQSFQKGRKITQGSELNETDIYCFRYTRFAELPFHLVKYSRNAVVLDDETHMIFKRLDANLLGPSDPVEIGGAWEDIEVYKLEYKNE